MIDELAKKYNIVQLTGKRHEIRTTGSGLIYGNNSVKIEQTKEVGYEYVE